MVKRLKKFATIFTGSLFAILAMILISAGTTSVRADELQKNGLVHEGDTWNYYVDGKIASGTTTLVKYNGTWWYVRNGKIDFTSRTLVKYNGTWWFVENGKINWNAATVVHYGNTWYYVKGGQVHWNDSGLCKYNGQWWYIDNGKINFFNKTLVKYNGIWWYVHNGRVDFSNKTLCKYNGTWYYVSGGCINWNSRATLVKYNGTWYYTKNGKVQWGYIGQCEYGSDKAVYNVKNGIVIGFDHYSDIKYTMIESQNVRGSSYEVNFFGDPRPFMISSYKYDTRCAKVNMKDMYYWGDGTFFTLEDLEFIADLYSRVTYVPIEENNNLYNKNKEKIRYLAASGTNKEAETVCNYFGWKY